MPQLDLVALTCHRKNADPGRFERSHTFGVHVLEAQRLPGNTVGVLEPGVADLLAVSAERPGDQLNRSRRGQTLLFDCEINMRSFSAGGVKRDLLDREVLVIAFDDAAHAGQVSRQVGQARFAGAKQVHVWSLPATR